MDYIEGLAKQASQITMYDVKSYYNQAKNVVLNVSETEAKVREATNDDPWGASSTLMQQIADGTHNFAQFNEIMPCIYARFMEKEAREWRQIYKALTLLEFLVKNGSERVVDDARAHVSTIKMLRSFYYVDDKGKDQGINVRNRASEIALLLVDVEKIRQERRKAKANKTKYRGQGNDGGMSFMTSGGSRYGGFGSESADVGAGDRYGGSGGGGGYDHGDDYRGSSRRFADRNEAPEYDEYEGADDFDDGPPRRTVSASTATSRTTAKPQPPLKAAPKAAEKPVEKPKEVNLFDLDDDPIPTPAASSSSGPAPILGGDDDFDDFQQATPLSQPPSIPASRPATSQNANLFDMLNPSPQSMSASSPSHQPKAPTLSSPPYQPAVSRQPALQPQLGGTMHTSQPAITSRPSYTTATPPVTSPKPTGPAATFDDLWTTSLSSHGGPNGSAKPTQASGLDGGKTIADLEREKAMNKLWGPSQRSQPQGGGTQKPASGSGGFDDLLM